MSGAGRPRAGTRAAKVWLLLVLAHPLVGAGCASGPVAGEGAHPPELRGSYELRVTVRAGIMSKEIQGVVTFLDDEWVTYTPETGPRNRVGPCRYFERGSRIELECGVKLRIEETDRGLYARVEDGMRETYYERQCVSWATDSDGSKVCVASREVERYRMVTGRGETVLVPLETG